LVEGPYSPDYEQTQQAVRINRPGEQSTGDLFLRAGDPLRSTVKVVCVDCNNQWLSDIQNRAKPVLIPLIKGERTGLGHEAQRRVAAWCAMATMTAEFIDRDPNTITVPQSDRDLLRNNGTVPPGWRIWLAHYRRYKWPAQWVHLTLPILEAKDTPPACWVCASQHASDDLCGRRTLRARDEFG
jgi:hypothetical protein